MQRHSHDQERKSIDESTVNNKSLRGNSNSDQEQVTKQRSPVGNLPASRRITYAEIKNFKPTETFRFDHSDDVLELRPARFSRMLSQHHTEQESIITINVGGSRFQTYLNTLEYYPKTLLGNANKRKQYWNSQAREYFFDRNRACFEAILYYYQSNGRLRRPDVVPLDTFLEEISFFELGLEASTQVHQVENIKEAEKLVMPKEIWRRYLWYHLELPQHSRLARAFHISSTFFTIFSCVALAIESLPQYTNHWDDICKLRANMSVNATIVPRCSALFESPFFIIQTVCVVYFTLEFLLRFLSTPSYFHFVFSFFNWVDLGAIVPYYVFLSIQLADKYIGLDSNAVLSVRILRILRFSRLFKIYLVFKRLKSLRVLSATFKESLVDFAVMVVILTLLAFLFGAATYFAEQQENGDMFDSVPKAIYWGIITITGVGYGDIYPVTPIGRALTCLCALFGSATMGMLVSVLVDRYQRVYSRKMYISEPELTPLDLEDLLPRSRAATGTSSRRSSSQEITKNDLCEDYNLQFIVTVNGNLKESDQPDQIASIVKEKLAEALFNADVDVKVNRVNSESKDLWKHHR